MFGWADSRFGKPRISFWEGFNFVSANLSFMCAASRFAKPRTSRKGNGLVLFAACKKYRKNTLGRAKSCQWQVFVRRRPPKQGELRTDVSKTTMFQGDQGLRPSGLPGTIQSSVENTFGDTSDGTSRNRFFAQNGGEKALNRCDVPALQRKDLERRLKEQLYSFVDSRLWLGANLRC